MNRTAVVLFSLGGPDGPDAVRPFLFNLFNDPAIIGVRQPLRWALATLISRRRAPVAREIYAELGGGSPLLANTQAQAHALEAALSDRGELRCFIAMRYWHPRADAVAWAVRDFAPDRVVLLPLYPQYSTTTSGSSLREWEAAAQAAGLRAPTTAVCCYPDNAGFVRANAESIRDAIATLGVPRDRRRILFSAHGLPKKVVAGGDPYQWQVERSCAAVAAAVGDEIGDWVTCYQSRVGPLEWIGPSTDAEIVRAGRERKAVAVVPIAFVSEHSETLVELDIEYRRLAQANGVPAYARVPTVGVHPAFVRGLADLVNEALERENGSRLASEGGARICPDARGRCAMGELAGLVERGRAA